MATSQPASFGEHLRHLREQAGLTQEELAEKAGLTAQAIGALERGDRRKPYPHTLRSLAAALGLSPTDQETMVRLVRRRGADRERDESNPLPPGLSVPPTPLFGRAQARSEVNALLQRSELRLLTMTGPGGVGKTRLAAEVAADSADAFPDHVVSVSLVPLADPALVVATIADAFGIRESAGRSVHEALRLNLANKRLLLLLDNFEHVLDAAPAVADLLAACPDIKVLVTSRAPLRLRGEQEFPVPPLAVPAANTSRVSVAEAGDFAAIVLFVARAQAINPNFSLSDDNVTAIADICQRLDGLPLAIELAAARTKLFSPEALRTRLTNRLSLLTGGARDLPDRQRTMRDAIAWSHGLCSTEEQVLFRRLAVFAGGATLDAIDAVAGGPSHEHDSVLDAVSALVDHSLLLQDRGADGEPRFRMLETIREYAIEQLEASPEAGAVRDAHARYFLGLADLANEIEYGDQEGAMLRRLEPEIANARAALTWLLIDQPFGSERAHLGLRLAGAIVRLWDTRGYIREAAEWLERGLAMVPPEPTPYRAEALMALGVNAWFATDHERAIALQEAALEISRPLGDCGGTIRSLWFIGLAESKRGNIERIREISEEAELLLPQIGTVLWRTVPDTLRALMWLIKGDAAAARPHVERSLEYHKRERFHWPHAWILGLLAEVAHLEGDQAQELAARQESLAEFNTHGDVYATLDGLIAIAILASAMGRHEVAAVLLGTESTIRPIVGRRVTWFETTGEEASLPARAALGDDAFSAAFARGRTMPLADAVALALALEPTV